MLPIAIVVLGNKGHASLACGVIAQQVIQTEPASRRGLTQVLANQMPLEFAAEIFFRFLFEVIVYTFGYATGWLLIPVLSFGYYEVEPLSPPKRGAKQMRAQGVRHPRQLTADAAAVIGILFWVVAIALGLVLWWLAEPK
ncbi:hypothetical protein VC218_11400 [Xanthomonas nasturtii]|uniref:hypothetical protein n=1 Tax=Xanthomonas nasturtii TaxID=1843581 RepID=UPI002B226197|nr:hypothetical protein [Xanthomonas nasturtii]MEA9579492.1 hypothetical protein [Xanthomonas nasturtii]